MKKAIFTKEAPEAIGPYQQAVAVGNLVFTSGQIALLPNGELVNGDVATQAHQVMKNLKAVLEEAGTNFNNAIKTTIFLRSMDDFAAVNEVYGSYFEEGNFPARETVAVAGLPKNVSVEISMIAAL